MLAADLDVAVRADDEQAVVTHVPRDEPEEKERRFVGPVKVVEDDHQGLALSDGFEVARDRFEHAELGSFAGGRRDFPGLWDVRDNRPDFGEDADEVFGVPIYIWMQRRDIDRVVQGADGPHPRPEGWRAR